MAYSGRFTPTHPEKYRGNVGNIIWRSLWELQFMKYCDQTPGVVSWSSEEIVIPYLKPTDGQKHRYFPDFKIDVRTATGGLKTFLIEIKPKAETKAPKPRGRKTKKFLNEAMTYAVNQAKWAAANQFCADRGWTFLVLTEDHLSIRKHGPHCKCDVCYENF